jgi:CDP-diglyceride synthetase
MSTSGDEAATGAGATDRQLAPLAGLVTLGVGDTCASVVGLYYGRHRWFVGWPKSVEGTLAGIVASFVFCVAVAGLAEVRWMQGLWSHYTLLSSHRAPLHNKQTNTKLNLAP